MSGPQELHLLGTNLTPRDVQLVHDGIAYTPLASSQSDWMYLLGGNGTNVITVDGRWLCTIVVSDVVVPEGIPFTSGRLTIQKGTNLGHVAANDKYSISVSGTDCVNLPGLVDDEYPFIRLGSTIVDSDSPASELGFEVHNGQVVNSGMSGANYVVIWSVDDWSKPSYLTYQGYIVAVTNYAE